MEPKEVSLGDMLRVGKPTKEDFKRYAEHVKAQKLATKEAKKKKKK